MNASNISNFHPPVDSPLSYSTPRRHRPSPVSPIKRQHKIRFRYTGCAHTTSQLADKADEHLAFRSAQIIEGLCPLCTCKEKAKKEKHAQATTEHRQRLEECRMNLIDSTRGKMHSAGFYTTHKMRLSRILGEWGEEIEDYGLEDLQGGGLKDARERLEEGLVRGVEDLSVLERVAKSKVQERVRREVGVEMDSNAMDDDPEFVQRTKESRRYRELREMKERMVELRETIQGMEGHAMVMEGAEEEFQKLVRRGNCIMRGEQWVPE